MFKSFLQLGEAGKGWIVKTDASERGGKSSLEVEVSDKGLLFKGALIPIQGERELVGFALATSTFKERVGKNSTGMQLEVSSKKEVTVSVRIVDCEGAVFQADKEITACENTLKISFYDFKKSRRGKSCYGQLDITKIERFGLAFLYSRQSQHEGHFPFEVCLKKVSTF